MDYKKKVKEKNVNNAKLIKINPTFKEAIEDIGGELLEVKEIDNKIIKEVRGKGLWVGVELNESKVNAKDLCKLLLKKGLLCKETHKTVIRFAPPLMLSLIHI